MSWYSFHQWNENGRSDEVMWLLVLGILLVMFNLFGWFAIPLIFGGKQGEFYQLKKNV